VNRETALAALRQFEERYGAHTGAQGPVLFAQEVLGASLDPWQIQFLEAFGRGDRGISVAACHGPGKTAAASMAVVYALLFRFPLKAVATAPSRGQLEGALMKEVAKWVGKLPPALGALLEVKSMSVELRSAPKRSSFEARTARPENPEALQGIHEDEGWVLILVDEATGVHERIYESARGSMSGDNCQTILLSNPTRTSGFFFNTWNLPGMLERWVRIRVSPADSARVTDTFVEDMAASYGRDSNAFRVRVLGLFPRSDLDTIVAFDDVEAAATRDIVVPPHLRPVWGLDVAYYGDDSNVLVARNNIAVLPKIMGWSGKDLMQTAGIVKREWDDTPRSFRPTEILIDSIGYGAGVFDRLGEQGLPVRGINVSETGAMIYPDKYRNYRTELWFTGAEWLRNKRHVLPTCPGPSEYRHGCTASDNCLHSRLRSELTSVRYKLTSTGRFLAESKDDMKKRGFKSPDVADAFLLTFAGDAVTLIEGPVQGNQYNWNQPLARDIHSLV
jgi:hypothetical protein